MLARSRVGGEEGKAGLPEFGADVDLRSPSRYGEYVVLGRSARWDRYPAIVAVCCMCSRLFAGVEDLVRVVDKDLLLRWWSWRLSRSFDVIVSNMH